MNARGNIDRFRAIVPSSQLEIKDTINEVKCVCGLVMTLEEDKRFLCLATQLCEQLCE